MEIDLRKIYLTKKLIINEEIVIPLDYYQKLDITNINSVKVIGEIFINHDDELELKCDIKGNFIIPCAISLQEVEIPFKCDVHHIIDEKEQKNQISLALLDVLWENIVLEVPIKVVKDGIKIDNIKGEGWELEGN